MPRPKSKKYAEVTDNIVTNLVACSEEVAKKRGYIRASDQVEVGDAYNEELNAFVREIKYIDEETGEEVIETIIMPVPED